MGFVINLRPATGWSQAFFVGSWRCRSGGACGFSLGRAAEVKRQRQQPGPRAEKWARLGLFEAPEALYFSGGCRHCAFPLGFTITGSLDRPWQPAGFDLTAGWK